MSAAVPGDRDTLLDRLRAELGQGAVMTGEAVSGRSAGIWGPARGIAAAALVRPRDTREVSRALALCHEARQPVAVHGGLTGVVDGAWATPDELVLSLERMQAIEAVDPLGRTLTVQAGARLQRVQEAAAEHGLMFPLDLGARGSAQIGGNAATNAGGNRVIRYGMIRDSILGLEAVLADGTVVSSLNAMLKNNAGYDLKHLFIGSEGTLGIVTRLVLRLRPAPASQATALLAVPDFDCVTGLLGFADRALGGALSAFEVMWGDYYDFITGAGGPSAPLERGRPFYVLIEALGGDPAGDAARFEAVLSDALDQGLAGDALVAKSESERLRFWAVRDEVARMLDLDPMFLFDVSLPIRCMQTYIQGLRRAIDARWPGAAVFVFGHLGDGNLHLGISAGTPGGADHAEVERLVYQPLASVGGSVSAEHGIGLQKKPWLPLSRTPEEIALMRTLKRALDPRGILNPGKVFDPG
jgi:FAD/FMN-containing dehydrogenase